MPDTLDLFEDDFAALARLLADGAPHRLQAEREEDEDTGEPRYYVSDCLTECNLTTAAEVFEDTKVAGLPRRAWHVAQVMAAATNAAPALLEERGKLNRIREALRDYHYALDRREHGGLAAARLVDAMSEILAMPWVQGEELAKRPNGGSHDT